MDQFTDLIGIEKEFGQIPMGFEKPPALPKFVQFGENAPNPHWMKLAEVLGYGPNKMEAFRKLIDQAQIEMQTDYEQERKKILDAYLKKRSVTYDRYEKEKHFADLVKNLNETPQNVQSEINNHVAVKNKEKSKGRREELKNIVGRLD